MSTPVRTPRRTPVPGLSSLTATYVAPNELATVRGSLGVRKANVNTILPNPDGWSATCNMCCIMNSKHQENRLDRMQRILNGLDRNATCVVFPFAAWRLGPTIGLYPNAPSHTGQGAESQRGSTLART